MRRAVIESLRRPVSAAAGCCPKRPLTGGENKGVTAAHLAVPVLRPCHAHAAARYSTAPPRSCTRAR